MPQMMPMFWFFLFFLMLFNFVLIYSFLGEFILLFPSLSKEESVCPKNVLLMSVLE